MSSRFYAIANELISTIRNKRSPCALILNTHRFGPHSKGDDTRDPQLIDQLRYSYDPIKIHGTRINQAEKKILEAEVENEISTAFETALMIRSLMLFCNLVRKQNIMYKIEIP